MNVMENTEKNVIFFSVIENILALDLSSACFILNFFILDVMPYTLEKKIIKKVCQKRKKKKTPHISTYVYILHI